MTRAVYRFVNYTVIPDKEPDAEPLTFRLQCSVCEEQGPQEKTTEDAAAWALIHVKDNREHLTYREHVTRPYRMISEPS